MELKEKIPDGKQKDLIVMRACSVTSVMKFSRLRLSATLPGSPVHEILQARILEWVAMPSSRGSSQPRDRTQVSHVTGGFFTTEPPGKPINILSANKKIDAHVDSISQCLLRLPCYYLF